MNVQPDVLPEHLQRLVNAGVPAIDIMHGELKNAMMLAEAEYTEASQIEEDNDYSDAMESMDRKYAEGYLDALVACYGLTYDIGHAVHVKEGNDAV